MVPGVNAAWRVGEEGFMKRLGWFEDLKVRASYGEMGNQSGIGLYDYIQLISLSNDYYPFGTGVKGQMATSGNIISTSRTWETIQTTNVGLISRRSITVYMDRSTTSGKRIRTCLSRRPILLC